uniref:Uncharacterized protein n=1 Tax=Rhizophora mucronata TaxID=61149 RepID=A0A2P2Q5X2_RHIMU
MDCRLGKILLKEDYAVQYQGYALVSSG